MNSDHQTLATLSALTGARDADGIVRLSVKLARTGSNSPRVRLAMATALQDAGATDKSIHWFSRLKPNDKSYNFARAQIARLLNSKAQFQEVIKLTDEYAGNTITEALSIARMRALIGLGRMDDAMKFVQIFEEHQPASAALLSVAADAAAGTFGWSESLALLERALAIASEPRLHFRRGAALFHLDRLDESLHVMNEMKEIPEFFVRANSFLLRIHQRNGDLDASISVCRELLKADPANEQAWEALIDQYIEVREFESAKAAFEEAHRIKPTHFRTEMFDFLVLVRQGRLRKALRPFRTGDLDGVLSDDLKERIATSFYYSGQFGAGRRLARLVADKQRAGLLKAKLALGACVKFEFPSLPTNREGQLIGAFASYLQGDFPACVRALEAVVSWPQTELGVKNFKNLARAGKSLSNKYFERAGSVPVNGPPLPIIQQLWVGGELSYIELLSIRSFIAAGHETHLYSYDRDIRVPDGCIVMDASEILDEKHVFAHSSKTGRSKGSLAGFADMFRWKLIYEKGGAWADCDVVCLEPIASRQIISTELARVGTLVVPAITNCFFAAERGEPAFLKAFSQAVALKGTDLLWGEIGIHKMAEITADQGWGDRLTAPTDICPIPHFLMVDAIEGRLDVEAILGETKCRAVHLYNEVMRMVGIDKNGSFLAKGLIGLLEARVREMEERRNSPA